MAKILFLGDLFYNYENVEEDIEEIAQYINENKYKCILNLEGSLEKSKNMIKKRGPNLYQSPITIEILKKLNVIGVTLSNNHIMDYGDIGLEKTLELLKSNNIKYCGAGLNIEEANKPMEFCFNKKNVLIYNYGWNVEETVYAKNNTAGCCPKDKKLILKNIHKENKDILINIMHWGFEYNLYPMPVDILLAHEMIDNGVNFIIGHHPHVIQAKEKYKNAFIYYSLGNFYFSSSRQGFLKRKFKNVPEDRCSYGLGIIYDTEMENVDKEILFYYDNKIGKTKIIENSEEIKLLLPDISNFSCKSKEYKKIVKKTKLNRNPILSGNRFIDYIKLKIFVIIKEMKVCIKKKKI